MADRFQHIPLDHNKRSIRLLQVCSGIGFMRCFLWESEIGEQDYTCLSYTWSDEIATHEIYINDRKFLVRSNLFDFLETARSHYSEITLWIDAICIDQASDLEKNHQVAQMGDIYRRARSVLIWLGKGNQSTDAYMRLMAQRSNTDSQESSWLLHTLAAENSPLAVLGGSCIRDASRYILDNGYFFRSWIVQEVALARRRRILLGRYDVDWDTFTAFVSQLRKATPGPVLGLTASDYEQHVYAISVLWEKLPTSAAWQPMPLYRLLLMYSPGRLCQDPRDKIYSLLSLADSNCCLRADYTLSVYELLFASLNNALTDGACICIAKRLISMLRLQYHDHDEFRHEQQITSLTGLHGTNKLRFLSIYVEYKDLGRHQSGNLLLYFFDGRRFGLPCSILLGVKSTRVVTCVAMAMGDSDDICDLSDHQLQKHVKILDAGPLGDRAGPGKMLRICLSSWLISRMFYLGGCLDGIDPLAHNDNGAAKCTAHVPARVSLPQIRGRSLLQKDVVNTKNVDDSGLLPGVHKRRLVTTFESLDDSRAAICLQGLLSEIGSSLFIKAAFPFAPIDRTSSTWVILASFARTILDSAGFCSDSNHSPASDPTFAKFTLSMHFDWVSNVERSSWKALEACHSPGAMRQHERVFTDSFENYRQPPLASPMIDQQTLRHKQVEVLSLMQLLCARARATSPAWHNDEVDRMAKRVSSCLEVSDKRETEEIAAP